MHTRLKLIALACAAPLALAACGDGGQQDQQVGQLDDPAAPPAAMDDTAAPDRQAAEMPAEQPPAGAPPEQDLAQAPQPGTDGLPAEAQVDFTGNWAMEGQDCPGDWQFSERMVEVPGEGTFEIQDIQENAEGVELEIVSMTGQQTQRLALEFDDPQQPEIMVVRNGGDEMTLQRCQ